MNCLRIAGAAFLSLALVDGSSAQSIEIVATGSAGEGFGGVIPAPAIASVDGTLSNQSSAAATSKATLTFDKAALSSVVSISLVGGGQGFDSYNQAFHVIFTDKPRKYYPSVQKSSVSLDDVDAFLISRSSNGDADALSARNQRARIIWISRSNKFSTLPPIEQDVAIAVLLVQSTVQLMSKLRFKADEASVEAADFLRTFPEKDDRSAKIYKRALAGYGLNTEAVHRAVEDIGKGTKNLRDSLLQAIDNGIARSATREAACSRSVALRDDMSSEDSDSNEPYEGWLGQRFRGSYLVMLCSSKEIYALKEQKQEVTTDHKDRAMQEIAELERLANLLIAKSPERNDLLLAGRTVATYYAPVVGVPLPAVLKVETVVVPPA